MCRDNVCYNAGGMQTLITVILQVDVDTICISASPRFTACLKPLNYLLTQLLQLKWHLVVQRISNKPTLKVAEWRNINHDEFDTCLSQPIKNCGQRYTWLFSGVHLKIISDEVELGKISSEKKKNHWFNSFCTLSGKKAIYMKKSNKVRL